MRKSGDRFQAENLGRHIAVAEFHDGSEIILEARSLKDADSIAKTLLADPQVKRSFSATRAN